MKQTVFADLHRLHPERINNKTNGITPRRWLQQCNPGLTALLREDHRRRLPRRLPRRCPHSRPAPRTRRSRRASPRSSAPTRRSSPTTCGGASGSSSIPTPCSTCRSSASTSTSAQLLNLVETVALYDEMRSHPERDWAPRVKIFAGKAASSYHNAKLIIKLANDIARRVNADPSLEERLKVVFRAELQRLPGRADRTPPPTCPSRYPPPAWRRRAPAT